MVLKVKLFKEKKDMVVSIVVGSVFVLFLVGIWWELKRAPTMDDYGNIEEDRSGQFYCDKPKVESNNAR